jgi:hypothetical protein
MLVVCSGVVAGVGAGTATDGGESLLVLVSTTGVNSFRISRGGDGCGTDDSAEGCADAGCGTDACTDAGCGTDACTDVCCGTEGCTDAGCGTDAGVSRAS